MSSFPIMLQVAGQLCVIVGGGAVALRRAQSLLNAGARVIVIAPQIEPALRELHVERLERAYRKGDLRAARLVIVATDDANVNQEVAEEAREQGVLCNRADEAAAGDFTVPAHAQHGPVTIAVHTSGISAGAAGAIRRELSQALDPQWPRLLELVQPYRKRIQTRWAEDDVRRTQALQQLTDEHARQLLREQGEQALVKHCESLCG